MAITSVLLTNLCWRSLLPPSHNRSASNAGRVQSNRPGVSAPVFLLVPIRCLLVQERPRGKYSLVFAKQLPRNIRPELVNAPLTAAFFLNDKRPATDPDDQ